MVPSVNAPSFASASPVASLAQKFLGKSYATGASHHANPVLVAAGTSPGSVELAQKLQDKLLQEGVGATQGAAKLYVIA